MQVFVLKTFSDDLYFQDFSFPVHKFTRDKNQAMRFKANNANRFTIDFLKKKNFTIKLYPCPIEKTHEKNS